MSLRTDGAKCRSCKAPIAWVLMMGSGKSNPLDPEPSPKGNVVVSKDGQACAVSASEADRLRTEEGASLYLSHFATCPQAKQFKRPAVKQPSFDDMGTEEE
jgi:hypothetical protein